MSNQPHPQKYYATIKFDSHEYTATVTRAGQLTRFLSDKGEAFRILDTAAAYELPASGFPEWLIQELNTISRFGKSLNVTATR